MANDLNTARELQALKALLDASMVALTDADLATPVSVEIWENAATVIDAISSREQQPEWSGWACQYPGKLPRLYGAKEIAAVNCDHENGDCLTFLTTAPPDRDAMGRLIGEASGGEGAIAAREQEYLLSEEEMCLLQRVEQDVQMFAEGRYPYDNDRMPNQRWRRATIADVERRFKSLVPRFAALTTKLMRSEIPALASREQGATGHTDGGRNMFYEGLFDGESERQQKARLRWADAMRAAFERHTGNGWFDKDWHHETGLWAQAWRDAEKHFTTPAPSPETETDRALKIAMGALQSIGDFMCDSTEDDAWLLKCDALDALVKIADLTAAQPADGGATS